MPTATVKFGVQVLQRVGFRPSLEFRNIYDQGVHDMSTTVSIKARGPLVIDDPERSIFKVHRSSMTSSEILDAEREKIFSRCWIYLGHESEVKEPGAFTTRKVGGRSLIFARDSTGGLRAYLNSCPHRGAEVCREDHGNSKRFTCFYHGWTFSNDGRLLTLPDEESYGGEFDKGSLNLDEVPHLENYRGFVFVAFCSDIVDLVTYLGDAREYLDLVVDHSEAGMEVIGGSQKYSARANWKLLVENSIDGYHALTTHATYLGYLKDLGTDLSSGINGKAYSLGNGHAVINYEAPWGRPTAKWEPLWGEDAREDVAALRRELVDRFGEDRAKLISEHNRNLLIFPNLIVNDIMSITIRTFWPETPDYMAVSAWALGPIGEADHLRHRRLDSFLTFLGPGGFATPDDNEALEACQRGFSSHRESPWSDISRGISRSEPAAVDELQMRAFWRQWNHLMTDGETPPSASTVSSDHRQLVAGTKS